MPKAPVDEHNKAACEEHDIAPRSQLRIRRYVDSVPVPARPQETAYSKFRSRIAPADAPYRSDGCKASQYSALRGFVGS